MAITIEAIRAAGGSVHGDGNIFFRDISMLQGLVGAAPAAVAPQGEEWRRPTTYLQRFGDAIALLCQGRRPDDQVLTSWLDGTSDVLQQFAVDNGPAWAQGIGLIDAATIAADQPTEGVAHEMRADRTPALEAPAHQCCNSWFLALPEGRQAVLRENQWMLADAAYQAGRESQPALEAPAVPERQVLTDAQITHLQETRVGEPSPSRPIDASDWTNFARAIEAAVLATLAKCDPAWRQGQRELLQYVARRACDPALPVDVVRAAHAAMPDELAARLRKAAATLAVRHSSYSNISIAWPDEKLLKSAEGAVSPSSGGSGCADLCNTHGDKANGRQGSTGLPGSKEAGRAAECIW